MYVCIYTCLLPRYIVAELISYVSIRHDLMRAVLLQVDGSATGRTGRAVN